MNPQCRRSLVAFLALLSVPVFAMTRYVDLNCTNPVPPYTSWATAATNIQDAIAPPDVAGFVVWVTNGIYQTGATFNNGSNRLTIPGGVTVQSVNGPGVTIIQGYQVPGTTNGASSVRCVYLAGGARLSGFTLTNGSISGMGGGVYCTSLSSTVSNCVIMGNSASSLGGGGYSGTYLNCTISGNTSFSGGGGAVLANLNDCVVIWNSAAGNGGGTADCSLTNCTVAGNSSAAGGGVSIGANAPNASINNCIVYSNTALNGSNYFSFYTGDLNYCCTLPLPSGGSGNLTNAPGFVDLAGGNLRLQVSSPCINAGSNALAAGGTDLDGNPRIVGGTVDMGAYEFQSPIHFVNPVTAATNIQDAIDAANAGDFVLVSNGVYSTGGRAVYGIATNRVTVDKAVIVQSVNGAAATIIAGFKTAATDYQIRCAYLTNGAGLIGFTLTNGSCRHAGNTVQEDSGGGIWCEDNSVIISNCVLTGNSAPAYGGGAYQGTLVNCTLTNNAGGFGGAACSNILVNCTLIKNVANQQNYNSGGGAFYCTLSNCLVVGNVCNGGRGGGGAYFSTLTACVVSSNSATSGGGVCFGIVNHSIISSNSALLSGGGAISNTLNNCILTANNGGKMGGGAYQSTLSNCTLANNSASDLGGGAYGGILNGCTIVSNGVWGPGGGVAMATLNNCIIYFNTNRFNAINPNFTSSTLNYCCTLPMPGGVGNITNDPVFVNAAGGDFHLQTNSPCINSGNNAYVAGSIDLDGNPRIAGGTVDMGAYEFQSPTSVISYAWLQQYGLPTDGTADYLDSDGDGMNNWQEWIAGTDPTNPLSVLKMLAPASTNNPSGLVVSWQSANTRTYYLQSSTNLAVQPAFSTIQSNIVGQVGITSFTDTTATNSGPYFYRVGVQ
jgi:hypothetical protein